VANKINTAAVDMDINMSSLTNAGVAYATAAAAETGLEADINYHLTGTAAANTIVTGGLADTIQGGDGADTLTGGAGADTFVFEATAAGNGADAILDFVAGTGGDVLDLNAFLGASAAVINGATSGVYVVPTASALAAHGTPITGANGGVYIIKGGAAIGSYDTPGEIIALLADGGAWDAVDFAASKNSVLIAGVDAGTTHYVYAITNDATAGIASGEVVLIGTLTTVADNIDAYKAANFVLV
jgi:hypothetical protein